ncbi:MAG: hypothetical protein ACT4ON_08395 [Bacteroidota bacterium]
MTKEKASIKITAKEDELHQFAITLGSLAFRIQGYLYKLDDILLLTGVDVEGPGPNILKNKIFSSINIICEAFFEEYETERIIIIGGKRTAGLTKGKFFKPIYRKK